MRDQRRRGPRVLRWIGTAAIASGCFACIDFSRAYADWPEAIDRLGRFCGFGWGDGYHACQSSGTRPLANLPPRTFADRQQPVAHELLNPAPRVPKSVAGRAAGQTVLLAERNGPGSGNRSVEMPRFEQPATGWSTVLSTTPEPIILTPATGLRADVATPSDRAGVPRHLQDRDGDGSMTEGSIEPMSEFGPQSEDGLQREDIGHNVPPLSDREIQFLREFFRHAAETVPQTQKPDEGVQSPSPGNDRTKRQEPSRPKQSDQISTQDGPDPWPPTDQPIESLLPPIESPIPEPSFDGAASRYQPTRATAPHRTDRRPLQSDTIRKMEHYIRQPDAKIAEKPDWKFVRQPRR